MEFMPNLLELVNPVFNTAKMTIFQLAEIGDEDAKTVAKKMRLTFEGTQNSESTKTTEAQQRISTVMMETRYLATEKMAEETGYQTLIDLPCGYTPRALRVTAKRTRYVGLDLPATIADIEWVIHEMTPMEFRSYMQYRPVDATNYESLERALENVEGEVCITTEGLMMYLTDSEVDALSDNIRRILEKNGGCWLIADPETTIQYVLTAQTIYGDQFMEIMQNSKQHVSDKADVEIGKAEILVKPGPDAAEGIKRSMEILASHGLKAERLTVADYMPELASLKDDPELAAAYKEAMKKCAYWKVTLLDGAQRKDESTEEASGFDVKADLADGSLAMKISGRVDTLTAPEVLSFFEEVSGRETIQGVKIDCSSLEYISSAGLRVMLIMHKKCPDGVALSGISPLVSDILDQTGFADIFNLE